MMQRKKNTWIFSHPPILGKDVYEFSIVTYEQRIRMQRLNHGKLSIKTCWCWIVHLNIINKSINHQSRMPFMYKLLSSLVRRHTNSIKHRDIILTSLFIVRFDTRHHIRESETGFLYPDISLLKVKYLDSCIFTVYI